MNNFLLILYKNGDTHWVQSEDLWYLKDVKAKYDADKTYIRRTQLIENVSAYF